MIGQKFAQEGKLHTMMKEQRLGEEKKRDQMEHQRVQQLNNMKYE